jgi:hypothetical protein
MKTRILVGLFAALITTATLAADATGPKRKQWLLQCDPDGCWYLSDGDGAGQYPDKVKPENIRVQIEEEIKCTWQWYWNGTRWIWACLKDEKQ